jgi:flagellar basal body rod protein FlgG
MNVGLYSGASGMRVGQDYQQLITENLSLQSVPGYKQSLPVFSTDATIPTTGAQSGASGNPAAIKMARVIDFSQGPLQPSGSPYHVAIQGQAFFAVREADGSTSYTRNGSFSLSPQGQLLTSDGASVLGAGGSAITLSTTTGGTPVIAADGSISLDGAARGKLDLVHFDNPSASLQPGSYGRFVAADDSAAKPGLAKGDSVAQGSLEQSNGNPVEQMANMIQAVRLYEANQKSIQAVDDNTNQLITNLGAHAQG